MTIGQYIDAVMQAESRDAAYRIVREVYDQAVAKRFSVDEYNSVWGAWDRRWFRPTSGGHDYMRGGPRDGSSWTGD